MTYLSQTPSPQREHRLTPREHATEMRARAEEAENETMRAYWLWLAGEWDKTADRDRYRLPQRSWADE